VTSALPGPSPASQAVDAESAGAARTARRWARIGALVICLFVVGIVAARSAGRRATQDVLFDDETQYLWYGVTLATEGPPAADFSPLYAAWYWVQSHVVHDRVDLYYANWSLVMLALLLAVALALRRLGVPPIVVVPALAVIACMTLMDAWPYPTHLGAAAVALAMALALRRRSVFEGLLAASATFAIAAFVRPELAVPFWGTWVAAVALARRRRLRSLALLALPLALFVALVAAFGNPLGGVRSFAAFGQYYLYNLAAAQSSPVDVWNSDFWAEIRHHFGNASSIWQAAVANPRAMVWQIRTNLSHAVGLRYQLGPQVEVKDATYHLYRLTIVVLASGLALAAIRAVRAARRGAPADDRRRAGTVIGLAALAGGPLMLPLLVVYPTPHHAFGLIVLSLLVAAWGWQPLAARIPVLNATPRRQALAAAVLGAVILALLPGRTGSGVWWRARGTPPELPNLATIRVLRALQAPQGRPVTILESEFSRAVYTGWDFRRIDQRSCTPFAACMEREHPDVIVCTARLDDHYRLAHDADYFALLAAPERQEYRGVAVPDSDVLVLWRSPEPSGGAPGAASDSSSRR